MAEHGDAAEVWLPWLCGGSFSGLGAGQGEEEDGDGLHHPHLPRAGTRQEDAKPEKDTTTLGCVSLLVPTGWAPPR